jgi:hypothetical protein
MFTDEFMRTLKMEDLEAYVAQFEREIQRRCENVTPLKSRVKRKRVD